MDKFCFFSLLLYFYFMVQLQIVANVRGQRYNFTCATVGELCSGVEKETGLSKNQQTVMFRGKILKLSDTLVENGISPGDVLNVIKSRAEKVTCKTDTDANRLHFVCYMIYILLAASNVEQKPAAVSEQQAIDPVFSQMIIMAYFQS